MKLYYFDMPGLAEISRIMLKASGTEFEDVRYSSDEWTATYKAMSPTGKCPFLQLEDGNIICQSQAIEGYIATTSGFHPKDPMVAAKMWMLVECFRDMGATLRPTMQMPNDEKIEARKALFAAGGALAQQLQVVEKLLSERTTEFAVSDSPTLADIHIFKHVSFWNSGQLDGIERGAAAGYPKMMELRDKVARLPQVAAIYAGCEGDPSKCYYMP